MEQSEILTEAKLKSLGFKCERKREKMNDKDGIWYKDDVTLYQEFWSGKSFNFATRLDDEGEFKAGIGIPTVERLKELFKGITGKEL